MLPLRPTVLMTPTPKLAKEYLELQIVNLKDMLVMSSEEVQKFKTVPCTDVQIEQPIVSNYLARHNPNIVQLKTTKDVHGTQNHKIPASENEETSRKIILVEPLIEVVSHKQNSPKGASKWVTLSSEFTIHLSRNL